MKYILITLGLLLSTSVSAQFLITSESAEYCLQCWFTANDDLQYMFVRTERENIFKLTHYYGTKKDLDDYEGKIEVRDGILILRIYRDGELTMNSFLIADDTMKIVTLNDVTLDSKTRLGIGCLFKDK